MRKTPLSVMVMCAALMLPWVGVSQTVPARVVMPVNNEDVVTLAGNVPTRALPEYDQGQVSGETRLERMVLVLAPSAEQQAELDALTEAQMDASSPMYRRWLTPEEYGRRFGVADADVAKVSGWLRRMGFVVEPVAAGRRMLVFSGTAGQVAEAFHVEIHRYRVHGEEHVANSQDPQVPRALAPVIAGVLSLHDFRKASQIASKRAVAGKVGATGPEYTQGTTHYLFPADFATIYDVNPLYSAGTTGTGTTIAIVGRSNISLSDVSSFRSFAGLTANQPTIVLDGANPGMVSGDQDEATLDVEWSGAVAPAATVKLVVAGSTATTDGVDLSAGYIVNNKVAPVMSTSFGQCESNLGAAEVSFYNSLWQQAASEGISVFVSSGDSGAAGCEGGGSSSGSVAGVNGLCSSPYSTCVGGTEFNDGTGNWWAASNGTGSGSALSYIPEMVWNESASNGGSGLWASGGGVSKVFPQPAWQQQIQGANGNGMRTVPDVALTASSHDGYLVCENGSYYIFGGTSAASPSFAGLMALAVQKAGGSAQGNANPTLYQMLVKTNPFHATPTGSNSVPGVQGFTASGAAYNLATGLGSVDAKVLVTNWPNGGSTGTPAGFTMTSSATSESVLPGKSATFPLSVAGQGGFTGSVQLTAKAPTGVTVTLNPTSVKPGQSSTVTIAVGTSATPGSGSVVVTGVSGALTGSFSEPLTVLAPPTLAIAAGVSSVSLVAGKTVTVPVTVTTGGSFTGAVTLTASGLPSGVTAKWSVGSFSAGTATTSTTLTLTATATATLGTSTLTLGASGDGLSATGKVGLTTTPAPAIKMVLGATSLTMNSTGTATLLAKVTLVGGVSPTLPSGAVFTVTGLPAGVTGAWSAATLVNGQVQSTLTLTGSSAARISKPTLSIAVVVTDSATSTVYKATGSVALSVTMTPALTLTVANGSLTVAKGKTVTDAVSIATGGSFSTPVTLSVTGLPTGVTASWNPASVTPSGTNGTGNSTLTLTASSTAAAATVTLTVKATGGGVTASSTVTLAVAASASVKPGA